MTAATITEHAAARALTSNVINLLLANNLKKAVSVLFTSPVPAPFSIYARLLELCSWNHAIVEARKVESHLVTFYPNPPTFLLNRAIETYGNCRHLVDAKQLFEEMPQRDGGSWNAMIKACAKCDDQHKVLSFFAEMNKKSVLANEITFAVVLASCGDVLAHFLSQQIHGLIVRAGLCGNVILSTSLVDAYGKCDSIADARRVFDEIKNPNQVTWNVIVRRYLDVGNEKEAVIMFFKVLGTEVEPLYFTFSNALIACSGIHALREGMQIHGVSIKTSLVDLEVISTSLISMYINCGGLRIARRVFDEHASRDLFSWTSIVSAYAMSGRTSEARELFDKMPERNVISWNAMLSGYTRILQWEEALAFLFLMRNATKDIDHVTVVLMLNMSAGLSDIEMGKQAHCVVYRNGFHANLCVSNAILDMYGKCGNLGKARVWFGQMGELKDATSWNALLTGYARHGLSKHAMFIFVEMIQLQKPNTFTLATILAACANLSALSPGKQIHGFLLRNNFFADVVIQGALVDMYSKCKCLASALVVFWKARTRDLILWNSVLFGCCHNGRGKEVIQMFRLMMRQGVAPDHATFLSVLLACVQHGCVALGKTYFDSMTTKYCVLPQTEHYECMIELFGLHGHMNELEYFVKGMSFDLTVPMLIRIFDVSRDHGFSRLAKWAADRLNELNPSTPFEFQLTAPRLNLVLKQTCSSKGKIC